ncbi:ATP-binding cassette sub-family C member 4-like isoform X2 [Planococcus citri]
MKLIKNALYLRGLRIAINVVVSKFSLYAIVVVYSLKGGKILPEVVFVVLGYCSIIAKVMSGMFFRSFGECSECLVSMKRIQNFLELNEFKKPFSKISHDDENAIEFHDVRCSWCIDSSQDTLKSITLKIETKKLTAVIGKVGSGKSSLLNVILGELPINEGNLKLNGSISYYSQIPWIFAGTIRKNIIFSEEYDAERYEKVIEACALKHDFASFPDADLTLIGERGITLSGGQKARVALARAVYRKADIYLLDDPLSAVDARVSKQIFQQCILDLLKDKTRILVSHQLQFLMQSDYVVLLNEGKIKYQGTFHQLVESDSTYADTFKKTDFDTESCEFEHIGKNDEDKSMIRKEYEESKLTAAGDGGIQDRSRGNELEKEDNETADAFALLRFLKRGTGVGGLIMISCLFVLTQSLASSCDIWLAYWTSAETRDINVDKKWFYFGLEMSMQKYFIAGYTTIVLGVLVAASLRNYTFAYYGQRCSKKIHKDAFYSVVHTNSSFFHNNPSGRILNRFSKDMGAVDEILIPFLLEASASLMQVLAALVVSASISVAYIVPAAIIFVLLFVVRNYYLRVSVNLKRLESIAKSPVFVQVHSTLQGLPVIRACSISDKLIREFDRQQDVYSSAWYLYCMTALGYAYCLEVICFVYLAIIVSGSFFLNLTGSQVGLALAQLTILLGFVQWAMKLSAEVSNQVTSVDRLLRYSALESEKQPIEDKVPDDWPSRGKIIFDDVSFRYNITSQPAIRNISFSVEPEEKIGIVGRTGAGKTSLLAVLFRLGYVNGSIIIDDMDTSFVRLEKLRSKISVIPQDPVLFSGTLRRNLDPFKEYNDDILWRAIEDAQLRKVITEADGKGLDTVITEGGKNFSVGQRQLICLARAIIRNNKILILDEATANVDQQTDSIIRKTIRDKLKSRTVLTIAHRLNTVVDSDKILVMDRGTIVEYGHPYQLLRNQNGFFYKLVSETGEFVAAALTDVAKDNYLFHKDQRKSRI